MPWRLRSVSPFHFVPTAIRRLRFRLVTTERDGYVKFPCVLTVVCLLMVFAVGCGKSPGTSNSGSKKSAAGAAIDPEFVVPDGSPNQILTFINALRTHSPKGLSPSESVARQRKLQEAMIVAGDKILALRPDDTVLRQATTMKLIGTLQRTAMYDHNSAKFDDLAKLSLAVVNQLRQDQRPIVAAVADGFWVAARGLNLHSLTSDERTELANDAIHHVEKTHLSNDAMGDVSFLAGQFAKEDDNESAAMLNDRLATLLEKSVDKRVQAQAQNYRNMANRFRLPGQPLKLDGKLLDGGSLDWSSYRGKVVLVDFWATSCKPCLAELPNVKSAYQKYHSKGFQVVAVSCDHDRKALENLVRKESLPWVQLFDDDIQDKKQQANPVAVRYGVTTIPTAFLVDQQGLVVSVQARGDELNRLLAKLLGPAN